MIGKFAVFLALAAAAWVLLRAGKDGGSGNMFRLKVVGLLGVAIVLFAAKLFPLALMIVFAAGGVTAIELWRERAIKAMNDMAPGAGVSAAPRAALGIEEAAAILGVAPDASEDDVKAAHRKLIAQLHPDKGGSDYLAAKINDARKVMLEKRGPPAPRSDAN
ncbi:MAG: DnaJ domain-containing protein [Pseudomonadota bacterium]